VTKRFPTSWLPLLALALGLTAGTFAAPALLSARTGPPGPREAATTPAALPAPARPHEAASSASFWRPAGSEARRPPVRVQPRPWWPERPARAARASRSPGEEREADGAC